jgi:DNA segregation ATPase FtsK/SpoIIIE-like protein
MNRQTLYIILLVAAIVTLGWLHWFVVPNLAVVTLDLGADPRPGMAFVGITEKGGKLAFSGSPVMTTADAVGWRGLAAWWPFAVAVGLIGGVIGWFWGRWLQPDDHAAAAADMVERAERTLEEAQQMRQSALRAQELVAVAEAKATRAQHEAAQARKAAEAAEEAAAEAERKLAAERERRKDDMAKTGARIAELKKKAKKQELDTD